MGQSSIPTAIFCGNDLIDGAMSALEEAGVKSPEDVSVIGSMTCSSASMANSPLRRTFQNNSVRTPFKSLSKMARSKRRTGVDYLIETHLVIRKSLAP